MLQKSKSLGIELSQVIIILIEGLNHFLLLYNDRFTLQNFILESIQLLFEVVIHSIPREHQLPLLVLIFHLILVKLHLGILRDGDLLEQLIELLEGFHVISSHFGHQSVPILPVGLSEGLGPLKTRGRVQVALGIGSHGARLAGRVLEPLHCRLRLLLDLPYLIIVLGYHLVSLIAQLCVLVLQLLVVGLRGPQLLEVLFHQAIVLMLLISDFGDVVHEGLPLQLFVADLPLKILNFVLVGLLKIFDREFEVSLLSSKAFQLLAEPGFDCLKFIFISKISPQLEERVLQFAVLPLQLVNSVIPAGDESLQLAIFSADTINNGRSLSNLVIVLVVVLHQSFVHGPQFILD